MFRSETALYQGLKKEEELPHLSFTSSVCVLALVKKKGVGVERGRERRGKGGERGREMGGRQAGRQTDR